MIYLFIAIAVALVFAIYFFFIFPIVRRKYIKNNFPKLVGKNIYSLAMKNDYYLINPLCLEANDDSKLEIDHILFGDKYIFIILDYYFSGGIYGKEKDKAWVQYEGKISHPKKKIIDNPISQIQNKTDKFSKITGFDSSLLVNIIVLNDDCELLKLEKDDEATYVIHKKELINLIKEIESQDVAPLDDENLNYAVHDLARLNIRP